MIETTDYRDWHEFRTSLLQDLFKDGRFVRSRYLFRGQSDADWPLISAYDRWFRRLGLEEGSRNTLATQLASAFKRELCATGHVNECAMPEDWILSLGQHNGLPTRLLDWSESPYIAALFAFMNSSFLHGPDSHVAIWVLDLGCYHWERDRGAEILNIETPGANVRLRNQEGRFTLLRSPHQSLDEYVSSFPEDGTRPLRKLMLPSSEAANALSELAAMGITPSRVFPDLQGLAMAATLHCHLKMLAS
jgi:FRG domain